MIPSRGDYFIREAWSYMNKDQLIGGALLVTSIIVIIIYGWLVFFTQWWEFVLKLTGFIAIVAVFGILGWIGYTLATTPPPKPIEEIEKELEEELKKLEQEIKQEEEKKKEKKEGEQAGQEK